VRVVLFVALISESDKNASDVDNRTLFALDRRLPGAYSLPRVFPGAHRVRRLSGPVTVGAMSSADVTAPTVSPPGWAGVGTCALSAGGVLGPRLLDHHVLMLTTAGHGPVEVDFTVLACRPGTLLWIHPGQALRLGPAGLDASFVTFESRLARPPEPDDGRYWQLEGEDEDAVITDFAQLAVDCERHPPGPLAAALVQHQLTVLQLRVALLASAPAAGPERATFGRFRRLLEDGHPTSRRVEDYATDLGCSVRTLTRACLAVTGRTAKQVVDDRVALQARRLLACTSLPVAEVGRHLGFPEPTNFGRFFHREVGASPGQFRADRSSTDRSSTDRSSTDRSSTDRSSTDGSGTDGSGTDRSGIGRSPIPAQRRSPDRP
jgi:AraC-like DNA-binding protein